MNFAQRLKNARENAHILQKELSAEQYIGRDRAAVALAVMQDPARFDPEIVQRRALEAVAELSNQRHARPPQSRSPESEL